MNEEYGKVAKASYENALELYNESKMLFSQNHFARAYNLAVVCTEELTKFMICKNVSVGISDPTSLVPEKKGRPRNILKDHKSKQLLFGMLPLTRQSFLDNAEEFKNSLRNKDAQFDTSKLNLEKTREIAEIFKTMEYDRQNALYVGLIDKSGEILRPKEQISQEKCRKLIEAIEMVLPIASRIAAMDDSTYRIASSRILNDRDGSEFAKLAEKGSVQYVESMDSQQEINPN